MENASEAPPEGAQQKSSEDVQMQQIISESDSLFNDDLSEEHPPRFYSHMDKLYLP